MRVIEPHQFKKAQKHKKSKRVPLFLVGIVIMVLLAAGYWAQFIQPDKIAHTNKVALEGQPLAIPEPSVQKNGSEFKELKGNDFRDLYRSVLVTYPNTEAFIEKPVITGDEETDANIRSLAEKRGFQLTRHPVTALVKTKEPTLAGQTDDLLQPLAFEAWQQLKSEALKASIKITLLSAYRSPEWQRDLFNERFGANGGGPSGATTAAINTTLSMTSIPGYSRHHTGYTVDFGCDDGTTIFDYSSCATWLAKNNYQNAKKFGWIPSYPPGADEQGPEPEAWEYVWVGKEALLK